MLEAINWDRPWMSPYTGLVEVENGDEGASVADLLNLAFTLPLRFVPQSALPADKAYEQFIFETGTVPTRDNLHDFFNGLCWLRFPQIKKKLNRLQAAEIAMAGVRQLRGPVRDALTVFDENAAFLMAPQPLWDALVNKDWHRLFITLRPLWQEAQLLLFGHALLEKLVYPRKAVTAHVYRALPAINKVANSLEELDTWIAADLSADKLAGKPFAPLPVLGVPGWWPENQNFSFYDDSHVFRPRR
jgi:hypothetical protein